MTFLHRLASIVRWMVRTGTGRADLNDELQTFVDMAAADQVRDGATPAEARRLAVLQLGGVEQAKERVRTARHGAWLDAAGRDVRYGLRQLRRNPAFSAIAIATLALGIGGMTAMFSAFDAVLIRPLPYTDADRLVMIWDGWAKATSRRDTTPHPRNGSSGAASIPSSRISRAAQPGDATLSGDGEPEQVPARKVTWTFWSVLGVQPMLGRVFTEDEDNKGVRVVVISHGLWQRRFGGASDIVGRTISLNDEPYEVIGVMPRNFYFMPSREIDMWMPASFPPWMRTKLHLARRPDRRAAQARRHAGARETVHGGVEPAGDGEGLPRPPFGDRHASAGRDRRQDTNRADPAAERVGGAAADRLRQPDESPAVAWRSARPGSRGARGTRRRPRQAGLPVPDRKPGARRARHAGRTRARPSRHAVSRTARARGHGRGASHARLARAGLFRGRGDRSGGDLRTRACAARISSSRRRKRSAMADAARRARAATGSSIR